MCGITGICAFNEIGRISMIRIVQANDSIKHRGPDFGKVYTDERTGLGHRRLSIIDLSPGANQPMRDGSGRYVIVFNGEIFNYQSIRTRLESEGSVFATGSDTEVLLEAYIRHGKACLQMLNGFFAFAIFDEQEKILFAARDRMGIKPFVYFMDEDKICFASEIRALLELNIPRELNHEAAYSYFMLNYVPAPQTMFKNVFKLMPGHCLTVKGKDVTIEPYYELDKIGNRFPGISYPDAQKQLISLLEDSIDLRLIADVPLGAFLSGGIDSSVIVALASQKTKNLKTFSIGYKNEPLFDETEYAELVANRYKTDHTVFKLGNDDFFEHIFDMLGFFSEPFADSSSLPLYILCKNTKNKVTVALSGDGADELFGGYNKYMGEFKARQGGFLPDLLKNNLSLLEKLPKSRNTFLGNKFRQMHRLAEGMGMSPKDRYWYLSSLLPENKAEAIFSAGFKNGLDKAAFAEQKNRLTRHIKGENFSEVLMADVQMVLPGDMLQKVDSMSMAHALEVRVPFLDYRVAEFAFSLPDSYKIDGGMKKKVLQDAARHLLPAKLYKRPKHGFDVPLAKGYKNELKSWIQNDMLDKKFVEEQGIFDPAYTENLKRKVFLTDDFDQNHVWAFLAFQFWWKKYMAK